MADKCNVSSSFNVIQKRLYDDSQLSIYLKYIEIHSAEKRLQPVPVVGAVYLTNGDKECIVVIFGTAFGIFLTICVHDA